PPLPTLLPYTTLFRSVQVPANGVHGVQHSFAALPLIRGGLLAHQSSSGAGQDRDGVERERAVGIALVVRPIESVAVAPDEVRPRSEEHTSELQSREKL